MTNGIPFGESLKKAEHKAVLDGEDRKGNSVGDYLRSGSELDLGIRGESKALKLAEAVF